MHRTALVEDVMQRNPTCLQVGESLDLADDIMRLGRIRHLPVLDGERLVGVVSLRDLLASSLARALSLDAGERRQLLRSIDVADVMSKRLITVDRLTTQRDAAALMLRHRIGCLPVVGIDGGLAGLVTETDLVRAAYRIGETEA